MMVRKQIFIFLTAVCLLYACQKTKSIEFIYSGKKEINQVIYFSNRSVGLKNYHWDFGDGVSSDEENPKHIYKTPGYYKVTFTATSGMKKKIYLSNAYLTIEPELIPNYFWSDTLIFAEELVQLTDSSMGNVLSRSWSMDNAEFSSEINPSKTFNQPGTYRITLSVTSENSQNAVTKDLTVVNPATFHQGNYVVNGSSQAGSIYGGWVSSFSENGTFDAITISKFSLIKEPVNINLDYPFVTINEQHVYNANGAHYVVSGNGKFEGNDLKINYHILYYNSSIHVYGTDTYTKQN